MNTRDLSIDNLRFIGLSLIILPHATAPFTLAQLRYFDVPLMIFVSGLTAAKKTFPSYRKYVMNRTKRLLIPVYIFISAYLLGLVLAQSFGIIPRYVNFKMVMDSYLLLGGVGYVWIIRVFLLMMLITPLLVRLEQFCKSNRLYVVICLFLLLLNESVLHIVSTLPNDSFVYLFITEYLMYIIGYAPLFMLGLRLRYSSDKTKLRYVIFSTIILLGGIFVYERQNGFPIILSPQYKYPPQSYFLMYGMVMSVLLYYAKDIICKTISTLKWVSFASFIGQNTIWIYLWHIPFVLFASQFIGNWIFRYLVIYGAPLFLFFVQYHIVRKIDNKFVNKYFIG